MSQLTTRMILSTPALNIMGSAAMKAGRKLIRDFNEVEHLQVSKKGPGDFVSAADLRAEKIIYDELSEARPDYGFLMEEAGTIVGRDPAYRWIVDPLDGTFNFLHGFPYFAVSIALEYNKEIVLGVTYDPLRDEMFYAEKGAGAYVNERRMRVGNRSKLSDALISYSLKYNKNPFLNYSDDTAMAHFTSMNKQCASLRQLGSATLDLCYVACGRLDGFFDLDLAPWDCAAGILIMKEAGGYTTDIKGQLNMFESHTILAANDRLHRQMLLSMRQDQNDTMPASSKNIDS